MSSKSQAVIEWIRIFPKEIIEYKTSSIKFMKQLTVVAVSTLTYFKKSFPEDSYTLEEFGGVKLWILKKECKDELAQFLSTALIRAFEALNRKYLHQLALCFYEKEFKLETLKEYHIFEYSYHDKGGTLNVHSKNRDQAQHSTKYTFENIREQTGLLIRACMQVLSESCQNELPSSYDMCSLRLYYNEDAPPKYQAPGYLPTDGKDHLEPTMPHSVELGRVETPFHRFTARSYSKDLVGASHEAEPSISINTGNLNEKDVSDEQEMMLDSEPQLLCSCNRNDGIDASDQLLTCQYCNTRQHAACYGVLSGGGVVRAHCCVRCTDRDPTRTPTDVVLAAANYKKRETLCIFRRTLEWCNQRSAVDGQGLARQFHLTDVNARRYMLLLQSNGIIAQDGTDDESLNTPHKIITGSLKSYISKYFKTEADKLVDRLVTEIFASQESLPDPVGEVISPLKRASLHSSIGRVIDHPGDCAVNEDATLKQYREAIMSNASEEPLSEPLERRTYKRKIAVTNKPAPSPGVRTKRARKAGPKK